MMAVPIIAASGGGEVLGATERSEHLARNDSFPIFVSSPRPWTRLVLLPACPAATRPAARPQLPPVTVAPPTERTVNGLVDSPAIRGGGGGPGSRAGRRLVTSVEFRDGAFVNTGDLLDVIDARPFEAVAEQADGQLSDARAKAGLAKRELERAWPWSRPVLSPNRSSTSAARPCRRRTPPRPLPKAR